MDAVDRPFHEGVHTMSRRARRRKARKGSASNHGKRPNS
jgi:hypothetical protein